jgi:hypothetical protein
VTPIGLLNYPLVVFVVSVVVLWGFARLGGSLRVRDLEEAQREDFGVVLGATLTLLGLIIGFSFSMATSRYDLRKTFEEAEANAIGTEFVRAELLAPADAVKVTALLRHYLDERIAFYESSDDQKLAQINTDTAATQTELWSAVRLPATEKPTPVNALVLSGMNDVLNSQGYTQAAWWNRIPTSAWVLMAIIAICSNLLVGYGSHRAKGRNIVLLVVPLLAAFAFLLIADLDSPRGGLIHVTPQNLESLAQSLPPR